MLQSALLLTVALAVSSAVRAQTGCPPPALKVLNKGQEIPLTGAPLVPHVMLQIHSDPSCPGTVRYEFNVAELTLMRSGRPVFQTMVVQQPDINMLEFARVYQPGDRLYIFVPFQNLIAVAADGTKSRYRLPPPKSKSVDLETDEQKGIYFSWLLLRK